jgi:hypothetical protein
VKDINALLPRILLIAKQAPDFIVENALFDTVQTLCLEAEVWQVNTDIDVSPNDNEIQLVPPTGAIVVRTAWVTLSTRKLDTMPDDVFAIQPEVSAGTPRVYNQTSSDTLTVYPTPAISENGLARIVCAMAPNTSSIPDDVFALYRDILVDGTLSRVLATPTDFGEPKLASYYETRWLAGLNYAKGRVKRPKNNGALVATYGGY